MAQPAVPSLIPMHRYIKPRESANLHARSYGKSYSVRKMKTTRDAHAIASVSASFLFSCYPSLMDKRDRERNRLSDEIRKGSISEREENIIFLNAPMYLAILSLKF